MQNPELKHTQVVACLAGYGVVHCVCVLGVVHCVHVLSLANLGLSIGLHVFSEPFLSHPPNSNSHSLS